MLNILGESQSLEALQLRESLAMSKTELQHGSQIRTAKSEDTTGRRNYV